MPSSNDLVVCCLDGSAESLRAARVALTLIDRSRYRVALASVVPDFDAAYITGIDPIVPVTAGAESVELVQERQQQAADLLAHAAAELGLPDAQQLVLAGPPGPILREYAREEHPALLVTGARGLDESDRPGVGEVPDYLVRKAPCPVLVVRADAVENDEGPVLVCTDGSEHAHHAAVSVIPLLPAEIAVQIVTVAAKAPPAKPHETGYDMMTDRKWEGEEDAILTDISTAVDRPDATHTVLTGPPVDTLLDAATGAPARAMVIGSKGHGALARAVLGSVAHQILGEATCPVFVAGPRS